MNKKVLSSVMSELARIGHKKSPRNKAFYQEMQQKSTEARLIKKKLSPK